MEAVIQDLKYGIRVLSKNPGFTIITLITLMLGIGANSVIFTFLSAVVLRPLPYPQADRLVQVWETSARQNAFQETLSPYNFIDWRDQNESFDEMAAYRYQAFNLTDGDQPERIIGAGVSGAFFTVLGVMPAYGRNFRDEEDAAGKNRVVIVSHKLWQRQLGSNTELIGQALTLNSESHTVIGIMPADFQFPDSVELWVPLGIDLNRVERGSHFLSAVGRLKQGISLDRAQKEMSAIAARLEQQFPNTNTGRGVNLVGLHEQIVGRVKTAFFVLLGAVGLLLLVACVNVANFFIARATARQKEIAIRLALGATRGRMIQQCLTETLLLSLIGGAFGLLLAYWGTAALVPTLAASLPRATEIKLSGGVLAFTLIISLLTGIISGLAPALTAANVEVNEPLKESGRGDRGRRHRLRKALMVSEIAFALVLLIGAALLVNSFFRLQQVNPGFDRENILTMQLSLPRARYAEGHLQVEFFRQVRNNITAIQGVQFAGAVSDLPFSGSRSSSSFDIEGRPPANPGESLTADLRVVTPDYYRAIGIPLLEGRDFAESDGRQAPGVAIINQAMAKRFWANESPIGKRVIVGSMEERAFYGGPIWREVVGVVGDIKHDRLDAEVAPEIYIPHLQCPSPRMSVVVRALGDSSSVVAAVRSAVQLVDRSQPLYNIDTMQERVLRSLSTQRMNTVLLSAFAAVALVLATIGIYGVVSYSVTQRSHEIGIRMALGAQKRDILKLILGRGLLWGLVGVGIGLMAALALTQFLSSLVYGITTTDPLTYAGVSILLLLVTLAACYVPARRASHINPLVTLKHE